MANNNTTKEFLIHFEREQFRTEIHVIADKTKKRQF